MSLCNRCGRTFHSSTDIERHSNFCDDPIFEDKRTPTYQEYLEKAAKKTPIYNLYLIRSDFGTPDNAYNPLATVRKGK